MDFIEYFVFAGGGMNTAYYAGIIQRLEKGVIKVSSCVDHDASAMMVEKKSIKSMYNIKGCGGTSGGALYSLFVVLGLMFDDIKDILMQVNIKSVGQVWNPQSFKNIVNLMGFNDGAVLRHGVMIALKKFLSSLSDSTINQSNNESIEKFINEMTFAQLKEMTNCDYGCVRVTISGKYEILSTFDTPTQSLVDAVVDSMRIPPYVCPRTDSLSGQCYIDGGVLLNFPFEEIFHQPSKTMGFRFSPLNGTQVSNFVECGLALFKLMQNFIEQMQFESYDKFYTSLNVLTLHANPQDSVNFMMSIEKIFELVQKGCTEMDLFLKRRRSLVDQLHN